MYYSVFLIFTIIVQMNSLNATNISGSKYIVGGTKSAFGTVPYSVALTVDINNSGVNALYCGGALVSRRSILTAGHCINPVYNVNNETGLLSSLRAIVGTNDWKLGGQTYELSHNATHPQYAEQKYDLGFLYTKTCVILSYLVKPIPLDFDFVEPGVTTKVAGYGYHQYQANASVSDELYEISVTTVDNKTCQAMAAPELDEDGSIDYNIEICTYHSRDHGTCAGDSGSALVRTDRGTLVGCVSWGFPCAIGAPDIFVRFSAFKEWITENLIDDCPKETTDSDDNGNKDEEASKEKKYKNKSAYLGWAETYRQKARKYLGWRRR